MFAADQIARMKAHARACYPRECCGLVVAGQYFECENTAADPLHDFEISDPLLQDAGADLQAIIHSHPDGPHYPTERDQAQQIAWGVPWGLIVATADSAANPIWFGDGAPIAPLLTRGFRWGVTDCYSIIRDWYRLRRRIILPNFARAWGHWDRDVMGDKARSLYVDNFPRAGFRDLQLVPANSPSILRHVLPGDVPLMRVQSPVYPNHAGVVTEDFNLLHHYTAFDPVDLSRPPKHDPVGRWVPFVTHWLRYGPANP